MAFWDTIDDEEKKKREMEMNAQYGYEEEPEEEGKDWLKKIIEYIKQKKAESARKANQIT